MASILDGGPPGVCLFGLGEMLGAKLSISPTTDRLVSIKFCGGGDDPQIRDFVAMFFYK